MKISTMFYQYEIDNNNAILPNTEKILAEGGLKETSRIGITSLDNTHYPIQYDTLKGHFDNKMSPIKIFDFYRAGYITTQILFFS